MYVPRIAKFWGMHNRTKALVFMALCQRRTAGDERKFSALEIHKQCGAPYGSIRNCLPRWTRWGYLLSGKRIKAKRSAGKIVLKTTSVYKISAKGMHYANNIQEPARSRFLGMLARWQMQQRGGEKRTSMEGSRGEKILKSVVSVPGEIYAPSVLYHILPFDIPAEPGNS